MAAVSAGYENKIDTTEIQTWRKIKSGYSKFADGDIIMAKITPCFQNLKSAICKNLCNGIGAGSTEFHVIRPNSLLNPTYLLIFLKSPYLLTYGIENFKGTAGQQRIGTNDLKKCLIPLPPLEEQKRIVACVENLRSHINSYQNEEQQLSALQSSFKEKLRASILQEAIQGKLVPQLESEPDSCQIGKPPSKVPFSIPKKWKWVALGSAFHLKAGKFISAHEIKNYGMYPCYGGNGKRGYVDKFNREGKFPLIGRQGALCGNINLVEGKFYATEHAVVADGGELVDPDCAAFFLEFLNLNQYATKTAQPGLSVKRISETPYPLPPLAEQKRIAHKVQKLFKMFEKIDCKAYL